VDPQRDGAVLRHVLFNGKNPWFRIDTKYQQVEGRWLPQSWTHTWTNNRKVQNVATFAVDKVEINPETSQDNFTVPIKPGMLVLVAEYPEPGKGLDPARPAKGTYRVETDGSWAPVGTPSGFVTTDGNPLPPESPRPWWLVALIALLATVAVTLVAFLLVRRRWRTSPGADASAPTGGPL
jgi:hypothetical protein